MNSETHMRLALGTAQFGMSYGITNVRGKVGQEEAAEILKGAAAFGVEVLDTAAAYGDAEKILGRWNAGTCFRVVTKIQPATPDEVAPCIEASAKRLGSAVLDTVLIHNAEAVLTAPEIWEELASFFDKRQVKRLGLSVYSPQELNAFLDICRDRSYPLPNTVQIPYSVFDRRAEPHLASWTGEGIELHARSVYLQGAAFLAPDNLPGYLQPLSPQLAQLERICGDFGISRAALLLIGALVRTEIAYLVLGVDSFQTFAATAAGYREAEAVLSNGSVDLAALIAAIHTLSVSDERIINPSKWEPT